MTNGYVRGSKRSISFYIFTSQKTGLRFQNLFVAVRQLFVACSYCLHPIVLLFSKRRDVLIPRPCSSSTKFYLSRIFYYYFYPKRVLSSKRNTIRKGFPLAFENNENIVSIIIIFFVSSDSPQPETTEMHFCGDIECTVHVT